RVTIGGRRGTSGAARRGRLRALIGVMVLGGAAGAGGVVGLALGLAWALPDRLSDDRPARSLAGVLLAGGVGALLGAVLCTLLAAAVIAAVTRFRRPGHPGEDAQ